MSYPSTIEIPVWRWVWMNIKVLFLGIAIGIVMSVAGYYTDWHRALLNWTGATIQANPVPFGMGAGILAVIYMLKRRADGKAKRLQKQLQAEVNKK